MRSETRTTRTPSMARTHSDDPLLVIQVAGADGEVAGDVALLTSTTSTAPMKPSASPMAEVMRPNWPGRSGYRSRNTVL